MLFSVENESDMELLSLLGDRCVGLTSGCWDLFHYHHLVFLQKCRRLCDFLIVGVNSDRFVSELKGPERPIIPEHQRVNMVAGLECVGAAFIMESLDDFGRVGNLVAHKVFRNEELKVKVYGTDKGAKVVIVPDVCLLDSTTSIIEEVATRRRNQRKRR